MSRLTKQFVLAGNAIFTVQNADGSYYTFKVIKKDNSEVYPVCWLSFLLVAPDNHNSYAYIGTINSNNGHVTLTKASRYTRDSIPFKALSWALKMIWEKRWDNVDRQRAQIRHEQSCGRCGRPLTTPESLDCGIGPECRKMMGMI